MPRVAVKLDGIEIDKIHPDGLITGDVCDEEALQELERLRNMPSYDNNDCDN